METEALLDGEVLTLKQAGIICGIWLSAVIIGAFALTFVF